MMKQSSFADKVLRAGRLAAAPAHFYGPGLITAIHKIERSVLVLKAQSGGSYDQMGLLLERCTAIAQRLPVRNAESIADLLDGMSRHVVDHDGTIDELLRMSDSEIIRL